MSATKFQKALVVQAIEKPLRLVQRPIPIPEPGWVLVKVAAAGINPHDQKGRDSALFIEPHLPNAILTQDIAGTVVSLGYGVTTFSPGDRIFGQSNVFGGPDQGGLQEYALLHADYAARIPENLSFDDAATIPVNAVASFVALFHESGLGLRPARFSIAGGESGRVVDYSREAIVVIGGGSNTGKFGLMFAKLAGFGKVITIAGGTGDERKMDYLRSLGATHIIDRRLTYLEIEREIRDLVGDSLIYAYDTVNTAANQDPGLTLLSSLRKGTLITLLRGGEVREDTALAKKGGYRKAQVLGVSHKHGEFASEFWRRLPGWIGDRTVKGLGEVDVIEGLDVDAVNRVLDWYRDGRAVGKTHVHPSSL
ncbi:GroES-like protein [Aspergillus pseudoustus]|uniref:GroES-like protein n=1 Tax=Aspergillus pseudoustus TaxID=1810923 RepID=A0ABR4K5C0_9EURO